MRVLRVALIKSSSHDLYILTKIMVEEVETMEETMEEIMVVVTMVVVTMVVEVVEEIVEVVVEEIVEVNRRFWRWWTVEVLEETKEILETIIFIICDYNFMLLLFSQSINQPMKAFILCTHCLDLDLNGLLTRRNF